MSFPRPALLNSDVSSVLGSYALSVPTGLVTVVAAGTATAGELFSMQYTGANFALIRKVSLVSTVTTAYTTAQETGYDLIVARSYTVAATGGTTVVVTGNNNKLATTSSATTAMADVRVATTGALTAGTMTIDANALASTSYWATAIGSQLVATLWDAKTSVVTSPTTTAAPGLPPIVLATNEGILIRNTILMGAVGVVRCQFLVEWDEVKA
jgi:hypothetical protein